MGATQRSGDKKLAFKKDANKNTAAINPAEHFKTLTKREFPDVMPHQKEMLEAYANEFVDSSDVALQLPTGSGKTLVGLLIADWRRIKFGERGVYLCPTKQLVRQTINQARDQYGIDLVDLSGPKNLFPPPDRTAYLTGTKVAVCTYSGLFNTNPFFTDPDLIIIDDAHAAENYIANMWSLAIEANTPLHAALSEFLVSHLDPQDHSRLTGNWVESSDATWVEKMPSVQVSALSSQLIEIIDAHADAPQLHFPWSLLRDHLDACHIYLSSREILIRPLIPPTVTHAPFANANQRIFMSATLGAGGDLERLTGRKDIDRLHAPHGFQATGVGRRFFVFPSLSLTGEETDRLRLAMQKRAGRSVTLTPSTGQADGIVKHVEDNLPDFEIFGAGDIEDDKTPFVSCEKAAAVFANRYDGIDFPGDECRLLCVDGLPKAMNAQERFIMSKMGAAALFNERIQTRVLQAVGRCTRALQDRSTVFVTGVELVDFLADSRKWRYFHPELQAELTFGVEQSSDTDADNIFENFDMFMENNSEWSSADGMIRTAVGTLTREEFPALGELENVVANEITYQEAMWQRDYEGALIAARNVLSELVHPELRGYRALWLYLAGAAEIHLSGAHDDAHATSAMESFRKAKLAAPSVSWLNTLARAVGDTEVDNGENGSPETLKQVEALENLFISLGTAHNRNFEKQAASIQQGLSNGPTFESAHAALGNFLGFSADNDESDAAPDPWWLGEHLGIVFEDHAEAEETSLLGAVKARQASGHPKWILENIAGTDAMEITPVLITPCSRAGTGASPHLKDVKYWHLQDFIEWATHAIAVLRELKGSFPGETDLAWRAETVSRLEAEGLTLESILRDRPIAAEVMDFE